MDTVAVESVVLSRSLMVIPLSITTGVLVTLLPSINAVVPPDAMAIGVSLTLVTLTVLVAALLSIVPSLTTKLRVRLPVFGVSELSV